MTTHRRPRPAAAFALLVLTALGAVAGFQMKDHFLQGLPEQPETWAAGSGVTFAFLGDSEPALDNRFTAGDYVIGCPNAAAARPRAPGGFYITDPGFAFRDRDCNGVYSAIIDVAVSNSTIRSGTFDAGADCLIIPPSVGAITASTINYVANGGLTVAVNLTATSGTFRLASTTRVTAERVVLQSANSMDLLGGEVKVNRSEMLTTSGGTFKIETPAGKRVWATNASVLPDSNLQISAGGTVAISDSALKSIHGNVQITADGALLAPRAVLRAPSGNVQFDATSGEIDIDGAILISASGNFQPKASTSFRARGACLRSDGNLQVTAEGGASGVDVANATLTALQGALEVWAKVGFADISGGNLTANGHVTVDADEDVFAQGARMESQTGALDVIVGSSSHKFYVEGAWFEDGDDNVRLRPPGAQAVGTPAHGGVV